MPDAEIVEMEMDEYVKGVVPAEMGFLGRRALEALKAQAIASRTYAATSCLPESAGDPERCEPGLDANVDTTTRTQVWRPLHYDLSDAAVEATLGLAVTDGQALIQALFFAHTRGRTLDSEASPCCGGRIIPYLRAVSSPDAFGERRGHGAGMSQEGAAVFADWGATAEEILAHYYGGTRVVAAGTVTPTVSATPKVKQHGEETHRAAVSDGPVTLAGAVTLPAGEMAVVRGAAEMTADGVTAVGTGPLTLKGPVVRTEFPFMAVAAEWRAPVPTGAQVHLGLRTSRDGARWSDWEPLLPEERDAKSAAPPGEFWSLLHITRGRFLQVQATLPPGADGVPSSLESLTLHFLNADEGPRAPAARALTAGVPLVSRSEWGANERLRLDDQGNEIWPAEYIEPLAQIVHHTVTGNDSVDPAAVVRSIYYYHAVTRGWGDIGYNFLIDHRGNAYEGRHGGELDRRIVAGGHALQYNAVSIGVALLGTYTAAAVRPSAAAESVLAELLAVKGVRYGIEPEQPVDLLGTHLAHSVLGHREVGQTLCPGDGAYGRLGAVRTAAGLRMAELRATLPSPSATDAPTETPFPSPTATATAPPTSLTPTATVSLPVECPDRVVGGDFEAVDAHWQRHGAYYTRWDVYRGRTAMFVGLQNSNSDAAPSYAYVSQTIRLPRRIESARLTFAARAQGNEADRRNVLLMDATGVVIALDGVSLPVSDDWTLHKVEVGPALREHAGESVQLHFGVYNNGDGRRSYMRLDDVALEICPSLGAETPPSPTPLGSVVCEPVVQGGGFEAAGLSGWELSGDHPAVAVSAPVLAGESALQLGIVDPAADDFGFAAAAQSFSLPPAVVSATLSLWLRPVQLSPEDAVVVELRRNLDGTRQVLLGPAPPDDAGRWELLTVPIEPALLDRQQELYLAVLNRGQGEAPGSVTAVTVDDVELEVCYRPLEARRYLPLAERSRP